MNISRGCVLDKGFIVSFTTMKVLFFLNNPDYLAIYYSHTHLYDMLLHKLLETLIVQFPSVVYKNDTPTQLIIINNDTLTRALEVIDETKQQSFSFQSIG